MSNIFLLISSAIVLILQVITILRIIMFLHMLQLEGYKNKRLAKWLINNPEKILAVRATKKPKKKLVFTARATRLFTLNLFLLALATYYFYALHMIYFLAVVLSICFFIPILLMFSNMLIYPLEATINNLYLISAKRKLQKIKPKVIAITGSYGKTSTKDILDSILSKRYKVLKTPGSFNTPMGICKVIRGQLTKEHEIFIVEMGAREKNNIKELCDFVKPEIGIITAIGPQHLEMFGALENIINTKYELIESLPENGIAILNDDDENCRNISNRIKDKVVLRYGTNVDNNELNLIAREISIDSKGIYFVIQNSIGGAVPFHCNLLGRHNVSNILATVTVALKFGMSLGEIAEIVKVLEPTPHRLQLIHGAGGVTVIDDAFNSNPLGAKMALEVLAEFREGRKVLVTPGLVELGEKEYEENRQLGIAAADVCNFVFLIGPKRTRPIWEGLRDAGFLEANIFIEKSLKDATDKFKDVLKPGDIVLFENDLPDTYNE